MKKIALFVFLVLLQTILFADAKELFEKKCKPCHGANGERQALGKSKKIGGLSRYELGVSLNGYKKGTLDQYGMGATMKKNLAIVTEQEISQLTAYISSMKQ